MKRRSVLLIAVFLSAAVVGGPLAARGAGSAESLKGAAGAGFGEAGRGAAGLLETRRMERVAREEALLKSLPPLHLQDLVTDPQVERLPGSMTAGRSLGSFVLADRLDTHSDLFKLQLGANVWDTSIAADAAFKNVYFAFRRGDQLRLARIKDINELRKKGVVVKIDDATSYRFKVSINIFNPVRGSTLKIEPVDGTAGPGHSIKTGKLLDAVKAESYVFAADGKEYWTLYGTDVDPKTETLADTRSLLFIHEDGTSSKAWPVGEALLEPGTPTSVTLESKITLLRSAEGVLNIHDGGAKADFAKR